MNASKKFWLLALPALLVGTACNRGVEEPAPLETQETVSPTPSPTPDSFQLEGVVVEASGSAQAEGGTQSPSPGATPSPDETASPDGTASPGDEASPDATDGAVPAGEAPLFQNASPGSIALRLTSFTGAGPCVFNANDTVVLSYTGTTTFEPTTATENEDFPNNLRRNTLQVTGDILQPEEGCVLLARSVTVSEASPAATPRGGRTASPRAARSPTARGTARPSPTATASPSPAGGSPGAEGSPGA